MKLVVYFVIFLSLLGNAGDTCDIYLIKKLTNPANNDIFTINKSKNLFQDYHSYLDDLKNLIQEAEVKHTLNSDILTSKKMNFLFKKINSKNSKSQFTSSELKLVKEDQSLTKILFLIEKINQSLVILPNKVINILTRYIGAKGFISPFLDEALPLTSKMKHLLIDKTLFLLDSVNPIPISQIKSSFPNFFTRHGQNELSSIRKIFKRQYENPEIILSQNESDLLRSKGLLSAYKNKAEFLAKNKNFVKVRKFVDYNLSILQVVSTVMLIEMAHTLYTEKIKINEFLEQDQLANDQIQIIVDEVPFPHLSLRVGDYIYSYGTELFTKTHYKTYLQSTEMNAWLATRGYEKEDLENNGSSIKLKLPSSSHSAVVSTLKIDKDERLKLFDYLESNLNKAYKNVTAVNDCATMVVNALKKTTSIEIPALVDASPNQINLWLNSIQLSGKSKVNRVQHVITQDSSREKYHFFRTLFLSAVENRVFIKFLPVMKSYQATINATHSGAEIQWYNEIELKIQDNIKNEIRENHNKMPMYLAMKRYLSKQTDLQCNEINLLEVDITFNTYINYSKSIEEENDEVDKDLIEKPFEYRFRARVSNEVLIEQRNEITEIYNLIESSCQ